MTVLRGVVYSVKSGGPSTEPWGTPKGSWASGERTSSSLICWLLSVKYEDNHFSAWQIYQKYVGLRTCIHTYIHTHTHTHTYIHIYIHTYIIHTHTHTHTHTLQPWKGGWLPKSSLHIPTALSEELCWPFYCEWGGRFVARLGAVQVGIDGTYYAWVNNLLSLSRSLFSLSRQKAI